MASFIMKQMMGSQLDKVKGNVGKNDKRIICCSILDSEGEGQELINYSTEINMFFIISSFLILLRRFFFHQSASLNIVKFTNRMQNRKRVT
jgi:hypothetical protein